MEVHAAGPRSGRARRHHRRPEWKYAFGKAISVLGAWLQIWVTGKTRVASVFCAYTPLMRHLARGRASLRAHSSRFRG